MLRGRVNAVHSVFIGISNELGAFESGVAAALLGTVGAVVAGGVGTIVMVALVAVRAPRTARGSGASIRPPPSEGAYALRPAGALQADAARAGACPDARGAIPRGGWARAHEGAALSPAPRWKQRSLKKPR